MTDKTNKKYLVDENKPTDWFETLYAATDSTGAGVPWAKLAPHPLFKKWLDKNTPQGNGKEALVIGCGLGDDAVELEKYGFNVTAFDISKSAIEVCKKRFSASSVDFIQEDLIQGVPKWHRSFDFVLEIFTIQALPPKYEKTLIKNMAHFLAMNGTLLMITEVQSTLRNFENGPPWLLNNNYIKSIENQNLSLIHNDNTNLSQDGKQIHISEFSRKKH